MTPPGRPRYETEADREREQLVATTLSNIWDVPALPSSRFEHHDFQFGHGGDDVHAIVEIKCRWGIYTSLMLGTYKWDALLRRAARGVPVLFVVRWMDLDVIEVITVDDSVSWPVQQEAGRTRLTRDKQDVEPCIFIPRGALLPPMAFTEFMQQCPSGS